MWAVVFTAPVTKFDMSSEVSPLQPLNIPSMVFTLVVSKSDTVSCVSAAHPSNM